MSNRHLSRTLAMQSLYQWDFTGRDNKQLPKILEYDKQEFASNFEDEGFPEHIINGVIKSQKEIDALKTKKNADFNNIREIRKEGNLVGVLSQINVGTVAGFPESLVCHATFFLFNYQPFSTRFEYLSKDNKPTTDVDECLYFIQWYAARFLETKSSVHKYLKSLDGAHGWSGKDIVYTR